MQIGGGIAAGATDGGAAAAVPASDRAIPTLGLHNPWCHKSGEGHSLRVFSASFPHRQPLFRKMSVVVLLAASYVAPLTGRLGLRVHMGTTHENWRSDEDWTLIDSIQAFTAGEPRHRITFWKELAAASPTLRHRTASECEARARALNISLGRSPPTLEHWTRLSDGRYTGTVDGQQLWYMVKSEGRIASDARAGPGYIEVLGGKVLALGEEAASQAAALETALPRRSANSDRLFDAVMYSMPLVSTACGALVLLQLAMLSSGFRVAPSELSLDEHQLASDDLYEQCKLRYAADRDELNALMSWMSAEGDEHDKKMAGFDAKLNRLMLRLDVRCLRAAIPCFPSNGSSGLYATPGTPTSLLLRDLDR